MACDDVAERHKDQVAVFVDHGIERVDLADHADDLQLLLVQRIAGEIALNGQRIFHEARRMEGADRLVAGDAGRDDFAAAGPARHEMRFHQTGGDAQIGVKKTAVDRDRGAPRRRLAQVDVVFVPFREMVGDADVGKNPWIADQFCQFVALVRAVQTGRDQNVDLVERDAAARVKSRSSAGGKVCSAPAA